MRRHSMATGIVIGALVAAAILVATGGVASVRIESSSVRLITGPTGELDVTPVGAALTTSNLTPRSAATGELSVKNQTAHPTRLTIAARPLSADLDDDLVVTVSDHGRAIASRRLAQLREPLTTDLVLESGERRALRLEVSLASDATGYEGVDLDVPLVINGVSE